MNEKQQRLFDAGFVRVEGLIAKVWDDDMFIFRIPKPSDCPDFCGIEYTRGNSDYYFIFDSESDQTWYKEMNNNVFGGYWTDDFIDFIQSCYQGDSDYKKTMDITQTVFSLPFVFFDYDTFDLRKDDPDFEIQDDNTFDSHTDAFLKISNFIAQKAGEFIRYLQSLSVNGLKPIVENTVFLEMFKLEQSQLTSVFIVDIKTLYTYAITLSQIQGTFPYKLTISQFTAMVTLTQPTLRSK